MTNALIHIFIRDAENTGDSQVREKFGVLSGAVGLACNLFLFALKLIIGLLTGSISIAADAFNNLSDGLSCLISIVGFKVSGKEPDAKHPFGYGRTEYIAGLIVSFIIILVGFEFFKTSLDRILHPAAVAFSAVLMGILAVSMLVKLWMGAFNVNIGRRIDSPVLMAAGQDSRNDVITTAVVVLGMAAGRFTTLPVDGYVGVAVAAFILWSGIGIAKDTVAPLLGEAADPEVGVRPYCRRTRYDYPQLRCGPLNCVAACRSAERLGLCGCARGNRRGRKACLAADRCVSGHPHGSDRYQ